MNIEFLGVRGTFPVSGRDNVKYGGHTPCALIKVPGKERIIVDAGTGISRLGNKLIREDEDSPLEVYILLTHFHLDHIMGLPFFPLLYSSTATIIFYTPGPSGESEAYLSGLMSGKYFPIEFKKTASRKIFRSIPEGNFNIGEVEISSHPLRHPQGSVAYRLKHEEKTIIFATDTEHPEKGVDEGLTSFCNGGYILVYDAAFTPEEYRSGRVGWGHSTWLEGTKLASKAGVENLYLSHFNPFHSDEQIDKIVSLARERFPKTCAAREESWPLKEV